MLHAVGIRVVGFVDVRVVDPVDVITVGLPTYPLAEQGWKKIETCLGK